MLPYSPHIIYSQASVLLKVVHFINKLINRPRLKPPSPRVIHPHAIILLGKIALCLIVILLAIEPKAVVRIIVIHIHPAHHPEGIVIEARHDLRLIVSYQRTVGIRRYTKFFVVDKRKG